MLLARKKRLSTGAARNCSIASQKRTFSPFRDSCVKSLKNSTATGWCRTSGSTIVPDQCRKQYPGACPEAGITKQSDWGKFFNLRRGKGTYSPYPAWQCKSHTYPNMAAGTFILKRPLRHATACKRPIEWPDWQVNQTMMTLKEDLDGTQLTDLAVTIPMWLVCVGVQVTTLQTMLGARAKTENAAPPSFVAQYNRPTDVVGKKTRRGFWRTPLRYAKRS